ncbi:PREDICTED: uncharacterized protein LOC104597698 [Nelumbo nucifera]|uniref:Uncharacterized protein LOC104597698 n=2 Tax=Nelumbo nucifera TaxID=4432 RepID=A0A1U7ZZB3_NELNU|nr:PREDICTED: uncharacterized protein LOC104597698 [Nelumbo nucifera]DAD42052.1 TPA_asm: hypothetical protein HUJ06_000282 [Nelumbo nucifera]
MGRNPSQVLWRELENLDKDSESRKSAMKVLKSYVEDLDSKAIPLFLAQVSETKDNGSSGEYAISLYEVLARVHGPKIVPQIDNIMITIVKTLTSSPGSFPLHQACSKVVPAIARYGIDASASQDKKKMIIQSLCKPLSDSLMGFQEGLASGAALCLKALVDADNWRYASDEIVNEICLRVAGALEEKPTQTNAHMGLVMALAEHNSLIIEPYARSLLRSGLQILNAGVADGNSQKRLSAIQMVNFLMKCLDPWSISSELGAVIEAMEKCNSDQMAFVRGASFEALQTARTIAAEGGSRFEGDSNSMTESNLSRRGYSRKKISCRVADRSPVSASPESQTVDSFTEYDSLAESPLSTAQVSCNFDCSKRSVNRRLWRNGGVDVSLKDGLYSEVGMASNVSNMLFEEFNNGEPSNQGDCSELSGFVPESPRNRVSRNATPSPQRSRSQLNIDDIFTTPRKLIHSLQDPNDVDSDFLEQQPRMFKSLASNQLGRSPASNFVGNGISCKLDSDNEGDKQSIETGENVQVGSESVSSNSDVPSDGDPGISNEGVPKDKTEVQCENIKKRGLGKLVRNVFYVFFVLLAIIMSAMRIDNQDQEDFNLVPT